MNARSHSTNLYRVPALEKGLVLLVEIGRQRREMGFAEILRLVDLPKASAYRMVMTLEHLGFLRRNLDSGMYGLGIGVLSMGFDFLSSMDLVQFGQPVIQRLRDDSGFSSHLAVLDGCDVVYVARVSAVGEISTGVGVGTRLPAHRAALGRALLMETNRETFDTLYPQAAYVDATEHTPKCPEAFWELLQEDRARGHVIAESFYQPGICSVAYPVRGRHECIEAVVSVMVPRAYIPPALQPTLIHQVAEAAHRIESFLHSIG